MDELARIVSAFTGKKILVIGDVMLDKYINGDATRISPEAPVPVLLVRHEKVFLGGAANVANNITAMKGKAILIGAIGSDDAGKILESEIRNAGIEPCVVVDESRQTTQKIRVVSEHHHVVRLDHETKEKITAETEQKIIELIKQKISEVDAVVFSDYAKGVITKNVIDETKKCAGKKPVIVDPKPENKEMYNGVTLVTPNAKEAFEMADIHAEANRADSKQIEDAGRRLVNYFLSAVLITRGAKGVSLITQTQAPKHFSAQVREIYDVSGAGDAVVGAIALSLSAGARLEQAAVIANLAGGIKVGKKGTVPVTQMELLSAVLQLQHAGV